MTLVMSTVMTTINDTGSNLAAYILSVIIMVREAILGMTRLTDKMLLCCVVSPASYTWLNTTAASFAT